MGQNSTAWQERCKNGWKKGLLGLIVVLLAGCKVSSSSSDPHYGDDDSYYNHGYFLDARDTGRFFPTASWSLNHTSKACVGETMYFETASGRVRVYGSPAYSENTFRAAATELDNRIDGVLNHFRMNWSDFIDERSAVAPYPKRLVACLSSRVTTTELSSASLAAVAIAPYSGSWPYDAGRIFTHDLAHYVQENLSRYHSDQTLLPLWFAEGQATVVAGEPIAAAYQHYDYEPLWDVTAHDAGNASYRYQHYGLAYQYLEKANGSLAMTLLLDLVQFMDWKGEYQGVISTGESRAFVAAFDALDLVDHRGQYLSFARYRSDYHALVH
ncbi:hypothetical protein [Marinobacter confluentis]|uniref:Uncharacterized protein n=1 Tax=Marinobacter confluentis TaxID=1697557 RepID=A0A4Z1CHT1_9GAMM|nr:hypothetical protein [Marinobacter confluentis]TGN40232.1 hypothetical protein E5Q11_08085 [Marinobacter confluentis]